MIKAIIFDCFGVLAEDGWMPLKRKYIGDNTKLAEEITDIGKQNEYGIIDNEVHLKLMADAIGINREELRRALSIKVPNEELFNLITTKLKPKYKVGLMTNANFDVLKELFTPEQAKVFDASVMSYESHMVKPDPKMFELMASRLSVDMGDCLFVDDQERYGMAAKRLGMQAIWYRSLGQFKRELMQHTDMLD